MSQTILIIEDDNDINNLLKEVLNKHFNVYQAFNGSQGLKIMKEQHIDLILLDLMLPDITGENLIVLLKEQNSAPIIVLTAKADVDVLVKVLEIGADDYIAKPFDTKEVVARIFKQLKTTTAPQVISIDGLTLNEETHQVFYNNEPIVLTAKEFEMLKLLMMYPQKVFTKANLYETIWKETYFGDDNTIMVHMSRLRSKLQTHTHKEIIETIWGVGFKFKI